MGLSRKIMDPVRPERLANIRELTDMSDRMTYGVKDIRTRTKQSVEFLRRRCTHFSNELYLLLLTFCPLAGEMIRYKSMIH